MVLIALLLRFAAFIMYLPKNLLLVPSAAEKIVFHQEII